MTEQQTEQGSAQGERAAEKESDNPQAQGTEQTDRGTDQDVILRDQYRQGIAEVVREREQWKQRSKNISGELEELKKQLPSPEHLQAYRQWVDTHEQAEIDLAATQEKLQQERSELVQAHQQELDKKQAAIETQQRYIQQLVRDNRIISASERANVANAQAVARLFGPHVKVEHGPNGDYQAVVLDDNGQVLRDTDTHQPISVEDGLARYLAREENAFLLKAPSSGGSGAGMIPTESAPLDLSSMQRRLQRAKNRQEFEAIVKSFNRRNG
ncbi:MAG: hypothetical protein GWP14_08845 [Actinobacteria bacterium]|nr:hypothetical protein [Actinomycetota bacterium]